MSLIIGKATHAQPVITRHPASSVPSAGSTVIFTTTASGSGTVSFQWRFRGQDIRDATNSTYRVIHASVENLGNYSVTASDSTGSAESQIATLSLMVTVRPDFVPDLKIKAASESLALSLKGEAIVERAPNPAGPWTALAGIRKNAFTEALGFSATFYRLRNPHPRTVSLFLPSSFRPETKPPLLILLPGYGRTGDFYENVYQIQPLAEEKGLLYARPEGVSDHLGLQFWNAWKTCCDFDDMEVDDAGFLRSLVLKIQAEYHTDPKRVHFAGHSNGAFMSLRMAQESADLVASIAAISGTMDENIDLPPPSDPVSVLQIHGTSDQAVFYDGGKLGLGLPDTGCYASARLVTERWAAWNGCPALETDSGVTLDLESSLAGLDTIVTQGACPVGLSVEHWSIQKAGHDLNPSPGFSRQVVEWLLAHPKP